MTTRTRARAVGAIAVLAVLCSGAGCSANSPPAPVSATSWADSPLGAYLGAYRNAATAREDANAVRWGEQVAACMKLEGFEYVPFDGITVTESTADPDTGSQAWTAEHGYGITAQLNVSRSAPDDHPADPNEPIVAVMEPAERAAYDAALWGDTASTQGADAGPTAPSDGGCAASASTSTGSDWQDDPTYTQLDAELTALAAQVDADPAVVSTLADWRACMAGAGHPDVPTPVDAQMSIQTAMDALVGPDGSVSDAAALAALRGREIDLAVDDRTCAVDSRVDRTRLDVQRGLEQAYVDAHRAELDAWVELDGGRNQ